MHHWSTHACNAAVVDGGLCKHVNDWRLLQEINSSSMTQSSILLLVGVPTLPSTLLDGA